MPSFRGITVTLQSQYDAVTIPESPCPSPRTATAPTNSLDRENSTTRCSIDSIDIFNPAPSRPPPVPPGLVAPPATPPSQPSALTRSRTVHVGIPIFPASQFWISYSCLPPLTLSPSSTRYASIDVNTSEDGLGSGSRKRCGVNEPEVKYYFFKLAIGGKCVLSWGIGEKEDWGGRTMYALCNAGTDFEGRKVVEKKGLFFPNDDAEAVGGGGFELSVFRAKARKSECVGWEALREVRGLGGGFCLTTIGTAKKGEKRRLYKYALIDAKDEPFVKFVYNFKTGEELHELDMAACEPAELEDSFFSFDSPRSDDLNDLPDSSPSPNIGRSHSLSGLSAGGSLLRPARRLSVPPANLLLPSTTRSEPTSPVKKQTTSYDGSPRSSKINAMNALNSKRNSDFSNIVERLIARTPSPMGARLFEGPVSPPSETKRQRDSSGGGFLRKAVASALRRKGSRE